MSEQRIGKTSEAELNEMAEESYRQITGKKPEQQQPVTKGLTLKSGDEK